MLLTLLRVRPQQGVIDPPCDPLVEDCDPVIPCDPLIEDCPGPGGVSLDCTQETIEWIDNTNTAWAWPFQPRGMEGRGAPPPVIDEDDWSGDGSIFRGLRYGPRELFLPLLIGADGCDESVRSVEELRTRARQWVKAVAGQRRGGTLRVTTVLGDMREITAVYAGGMSWVEESNRRQAMGVQLRAHDPMWRDTTDTIVTWQVETSANFFPIPNPDTGSFITLSAAAVLAEETINNAGDADAYPVWKITGPTFGNILIDNATTGERISLDRAIGPGDFITIDTRIGLKTVFDQDGLNRFADLSADSTLFSLPPGPNALRISMENAEVGTSVELRYRRRWLTV